jgi:NAD(P)-dependent dehydrogenase (short-subunit alcohol dehydrogenase family)
MHETMLHEFDETLRVNVRGVFLGCKYAVEQMLSQTPMFGQDRGWSESKRVTPQSSTFVRDLSLTF